TGVFLTNMTDFAAMNGIYAKYFSQPFPARTDDRGCRASCAIATSADSRAHPFGSSLPASWCWLPQTNAECRVPAVRQPSPKRRVVQPALLRRTTATQTTGGATLQLCL